MAGEKGMDCSNTTQCICVMARLRRIYGLLTPRSKRTHNIGAYECTQIGYKNKKKKEIDKAGEEKMECILAKEIKSLKKPIPGILQSRERRIGVHLVSFNELKKDIATDLCGVYPTMSNRGMKCILVLYDYDSNAILARAMKTNKGQAITTAFKAIYNEL